MGLGCHCVLELAEDLPNLQRPAAAKAWQRAWAIFAVSTERGQQRCLSFPGNGVILGVLTRKGKGLTAVVSPGHGPSKKRMAR
jgi:hypothetical protein